MRALPAPESKKSGRRRLLLGLGSLALLGGMATAIIKFLPSGGSGERSDWITHVVAKGNLTVAITERGTLEAAENKDVICQVKAGKGSTIATTIRAVLVDDGARVRAGDQLIHLDDSGLQEQLKAQKIVRDKAKNEWNAAVQNLEITISQNSKEIASAKVAEELAALDLNKYKEGDLPQVTNEIKGRVLVAESDLEMWKDREIWNDRMVSKSYRTGNQAMSDRFKQQSAQLSLKKIREELQVLERFTAPRTIKEMESKIAESKSTYKTSLIQALAKEKQNRGDSETKESVYKQEEQRCSELEEEIHKCNITAPQDGLVVFYVPEQARMGSGSQQSIIAQGEPVREGQKLMRIPNLDRMFVNVRVHEAMRAKVRGDIFLGLNEIHPLFTLGVRSRLGLLVHESVNVLDRESFRDIQPIKIRGGLKALVRIDAFPTKALTGHVKLVDEVPAATDFWTSDITVYRTMVSIDDGLTPSSSEEMQLKPGMKASVTIQTDSKVEDAILIPIQAVKGTAKEGFTVTVKVGTGTEIRKVKPGLSDEKWVEIQSGLTEGEEIVMNASDGNKAPSGDSKGSGTGKGGPGMGKDGKGGGAPGGMGGAPPAGMGGGKGFSKGG
jgi:HlyD family secretion protein